MTDMNCDACGRSGKLCSHYFQLYEQAPVGYLTINRKGLIVDANLTFGTLIAGRNGNSETLRDSFIKKPLSRFIFPEDQDIYCLYSKLLFETGLPQTCELRLVNSDGEKLWIRLEAKLAQNANVVHAVISDINERIQAEKAQRESEERFRSYFQKNRSVMFLVNTETACIVDANPAAADYYGYPLAQLKQMKVTEINTLSPIEIAKKMENAVLLRENVFNFSHRLSSGEIRHVEEYSTPIRFDQRDQLLTIVHDITEHKRAESALRESEERLREVLENSLDAAYKRNLQTNAYDYLSPVFTRISGYTQDEMNILPMESVMDLMHPDDMNEIERMIAESMPGATGTAYHLEYRFKHKDGHYRWFYDQFTIVRNTDGQALARIGSVSDITDRKRVDDALLESEKRYRELIQDANVIIVAINDQGKITFMNDYGLSFFGYTAGELIGKTEVETILPEYESTGRNLLKISEDVKANVNLYQNYTHENITKSRRRVWVNWTNRGIVDRETGEKKLLCVGIDVTTARRAEQVALRQYDRFKIRDILNDGINRRISQTNLLSELRQAGWVLELPFVLNLLTIPAEYLSATGSNEERWDRQHHIDLLIDLFHDSSVGVAGQTPTGVVVVQSLSEQNRFVSADKVKSAAIELMKLVSRYWLGTKIVIGVSHSTDEVHDVAELFEQARAALQYGPVLAPGQSVYHWHDLGCFQFIVKDMGSVQVRQFIHEQLGPLLGKNGAVNDEEGLTTLRAIISGDSLQVIANRLFVHKQTVVFRKKKLEDILGVDLDVLETRTNLNVAMKLLSSLT